MHIVDDNVWPGSGPEIEAKLLEARIVISDHHGGFASSNPYLTAVSTVFAREEERKALGLTPENTTVITTVKNVDEDGIDGLVTALGLVPSKLRSQVEATSIFTDCTMFGGRAFKPGYQLTDTAEIAGFAINPNFDR
ncbi:TPA: hypothetical protein HA241_01910 [Candidatus Woesearchaeota archaeon]|nr:hypothetical protein [Candidatus Woesearchaeota archaeon]